MTAKALLLSDIPPCSNYTGGVVLADQCRELQPGSLSAFIVLNPDLCPEVYEELSWIPIRTVDKPNEYWASQRGSREAVAGETYNAQERTPQLVAEAAAFGREQGVDAVWAVLEGQTVTRMALALAVELGVPLYCQVWDPLSWWLDAHGVDPNNAADAHQAFDAAIRASRGVATASWAMAEHYERLFGVRAMPVINSQGAEVARQPAPKLRTGERLTIGMVGQFYASDAWSAFTTGLDRVSWRLGQREVEIYYLGHEPPANIPPERLLHGGWKSQPDAIAALSEYTDVCYCPYPFARAMEEVARFSFPSKLVMYAAAGRPIFCHAPWYSSPARYIARTRAGVVCGDLDPGACLALLRWLVGDVSVYAESCLQAQAAFLNDFNRVRMRDNFRGVLEWNVSS